MIGEDVQQHRRFRRFVRSVITGLAVLLVALAAASWIAWRQRMLAVSRELAATALVQVLSRPDLGQLLALEALAAAPTVQAERALRETLIKGSARGDLVRIRQEALLGATAQRFAGELPSHDVPPTLRSAHAARVPVSVIRASRPAGSAAPPARSTSR
jgi:hypothetical protein